MARKPSRFYLHVVQDRLSGKTPSFRLKDDTYKPLEELDNHIVRLRNACGWEKSRDPMYVRILPLEDQNKLAEGQLAIGDTQTYVDISRIKSVQTSGGCFVASAVFGDPNVWQVEAYRSLDHEVLQQHRVTSRFSEWYHNGGGQRLADIVESYPYLRSPVKAMLGLGARVLRYVRK